MSLFQTILSQVKEKLSSQEHELESVAAFISQTIGVTVSSAQLSAKKGTLILSVQPTVKVAILSKKDVILRYCTEHQLPFFSIA